MRPDDRGHGRQSIGVATLNGFVSANTIAILPDARILLDGMIYISFSEQTQFNFVRLTSAGQLDTTSGAGGNGDDDLELSVSGAGALDELFALLDGGAGFDAGRATENVLVKNIEQFTPIGQ